MALKDENKKADESTSSDHHVGFEMVRRLSSQCQTGGNYCQLAGASAGDKRPLPPQPPVPIVIALPQAPCGTGL